MKLTDMTIEEMCTTTEKQSFDRKSAKEEAGLPEPEYKTVAFMAHATIRNKKYLADESLAVSMYKDVPKRLH